MLSFGDNIFFNLPCEYATSTTYKKIHVVFEQRLEKNKIHWNYHQMWIDLKMVNTYHYHIEGKKLQHKILAIFATSKKFFKIKEAFQTH
jgi:hypothetical protein